MATYLINGQSPASLGVELCRRVRRNQAIDTVTLQVTTEEGITGVLPFAYDDEVVITRDGVTWFRGWVMSPIVAGQSGMEGMSIEIGGPWWQLMRLTYTQLTLPVGGKQPRDTPTERPQAESGRPHWRSSARCWTTPLPKEQ
ncbi:hypothetical protein [Verrucomicrobium spinosum]|uniref:hypothetical protein n=1 Tax=Verrucomicrobium spinosum TaxID=2736 RepID=UPI00094675C3|nr:hypothetical protein [Verrucomicrobium spinosum]